MVTIFFENVCNKFSVTAMKGQKDVFLFQN